MKNRTAIKRSVTLRAFLYVFVISGVLLVTNACHKSTTQSKPLVQAIAVAPVPSADGSSLSCVYNVAAVHTSADGKSARVLLLQNEEIFTVTDAALITSLQNALKANNPVKITFNPWSATLLSVSEASNAERTSVAPRQLVSGGVPYAMDINTADTETINKAFAVININTKDSLTAVIPDMETAQAMFDYIEHQCCAIAGPYAVDYCITFQYCEDGCYARAHKMCWILNNRYHYATQKVFSFANDSAGVDYLCVKAEKWGGCCINWWYHVAPLLNINTPGGVKAYVFDPAMFDQPVLLTEWLHAQQNPACVPTGDYLPHVTMINIQPTSSYWPASYSGYTFDTDPLYASTDSTLVNYSALITCH